MTFLYKCCNLMNMKRFLFSFLILTMLTPMLMCGAGIGMQKAQADTPCHEGQTNDMQDDMMFMFDCMGVDLQTVNDDVSVKKPEHSSKIISYDAAFLAASHQFSTGLKKARAPPGFMARKTSFTYPTILATQRFLI